MFPFKNLKTFLDTSHEWHSFVLGVLFCPLFIIRRHQELRYVLDELHYFFLGRFLGVLFWVGILLIVLEVVRR